MSSLEPEEIGADDKQNVHHIDARAYNTECFDLHIKRIGQVQRGKQRKARNQKQILYLTKKRQNNCDKIKEHSPGTVRNAEGFTIRTCECFSAQRAIIEITRGAVSLFLACKLLNMIRVP